MKRSAALDRDVALRAPRNDDSIRPFPAIPAPCLRELDRLPMRRAEIGALPLVLTLVELRARDAAAFRKHPLERREHRAVVSLAVVGRGFERLDLCPERLGPSRRRDHAAPDEKIGESERLRVPRLAKRRLAVLGLEKALPKLRPVQDSSPRDRRRRGRGSRSLPAKGRKRRSLQCRDARPASRRAPTRQPGHGRRDGRGSPLPCPAHIQAGAYGRSRRRAGIAPFRPAQIAAAY